MSTQKTFNVLDCTLRDGGYYTQWDFDTDIVDAYAHAMNEAPIDYIEIGYRSIEKTDTYYGEYFYLPLQTIKALKEKMPDKKLALMLNAKECIDIDLSVLLEGCADNIDLVRVAIAPQALPDGIAVAEQLAELGFRVALNVMQISKLQDDNTLLTYLDTIAQTVEYLYLVDSYGAMYPNDLRTFIQKVQEGLGTHKVKLGFHGHNNLELAFANTLAAIETGIDMVDTTVLGMGRGAGNLDTSLLLAYMQSRLAIDTHLNTFGVALAQFQQLKNKHTWGTNHSYMLSGAYSLPQKDVMELLSKMRYSIADIANMLKNQAHEQPATQYTAVQATHAHDVLIVGGGPSVVKHLDAITSFLKQSPDTVVIHSSTKHVTTLQHISNTQLLTLAGSEACKLDSVGPEVLKKMDSFIFAPSPRYTDCEMPSGTKEKTYELEHVDFTKTFIDTPLTISLQAALDNKANTIYVAGFDGYDAQFGEKERLLTNENQETIDDFLKAHAHLYSITPTTYANIKPKSIYALVA